MMTGDEVRRLALALPEAEEQETWGHPTFRVRDKIFASLSPDGSGAGVKTSPQEQSLLISADPESFSVADYVGRFGWVSVNLSTVDPGTVRGIIVEAWGGLLPSGWSRNTTPCVSLRSACDGLAGSRPRSTIDPDPV